MTAFGLTVAAAARICYQGAAVACTVVDTEGRRTFEARHEPFVCVLPAGTIEIQKADGARRSLEIDDGLARFDGRRCLILVTPRGAP